MTEEAPKAVVVDDEKSMARVMLWVLKDLGFQASHFETAEAAMEDLMRAAPNVVLSDVRLPGLGGVQLAEWIKDQPLLSQIPVILMSAFREPAGHKADSFISKPYDIEDLGSLLRRLTG
jgi:CheY-like chemotaxis protein